MKLKYLVLGASCLALGASTAWAKPKILDGSVIGHWTFDDGAASADVSGYEGGTVPVPGSTVGSLESSDGYKGSGYLLLESGKSIAVSYGENAPAFNGTTSPFHTFVARFRSSNSRMVGSSSSNHPEIFNDTSGWHYLVYRYSKKLTSGYNEVVVADPQYYEDNNWYAGDNSSSDTSRPEFTYDYGSVSIPIAVDASGKKVTIGGKVKVGLSSTSVAGGFDDVMVINRMLTKREMTRVYQTGETYIYPITAPSFTGDKCWSSYEGKDSSTYYAPTPGQVIGAAYLIDNGYTLSCSGGVFGGSVDKHVSLTVGRLSTFSYTVPVGRIVSPKVAGVFEQTGADSSAVFYDLRLNDGTITANADGQSLTTTLLDVEASVAKPFSVSVGSGQTYTFNAGGQVTGSGVLAKTGSGKLVLNNFTAAAGESPKIRLAAGSIKTPRLDGYTDGTVLVAKGSTVAFSGADALPTAEKKMKIAFDGEKPTAKTAVMTVPAGVTAAMVRDVTQYDGGKVGDVTVENGVVYVEPGYPEDKGAKPMLIWQ